MLTFPNFLSLLRGPLALLFLQDNTTLRTIAIMLAMATDFLDGYISRNYRLTSRLGSLLDPLMDKLFVLFVMGVLITEQRLGGMQAVMMFSRDFSVLLFGTSLLLKGTLLTYKFRAIWCGKVTTTLQFMILLGLTHGFFVPAYLYLIFLFLGFFALVELYLMESNQKLASGE